MKKVEWINIIMWYINNCVYFIIFEIMWEFNIFCLIVIRDIREIEVMGMLFVVEVGRSGGYFVMNYFVLFVVCFIDNEIKVFFIVFMVIRN